MQIQTATDAAWETIGELEDYPATTATDTADLKGGERFTCELASPVKVLAVRVLGKPACGDNPHKPFRPARNYRPSASLAEPPEKAPVGATCL